MNSPLEGKVHLRGLGGPAVCGVPCTGASATRLTDQIRKEHRAARCLPSHQVVRGCGHTLASGEKDPAGRGMRTSTRAATPPDLETSGLCPGRGCGTFRDQELSHARRPRARSSIQQLHHTPMPFPFSARLPPLPWWRARPLRRLAGAASLLAVLGATAYWHFSAPPGRGLLTGLGREAGTRQVGPRLTITRHHAPCTLQLAPESAIPRTRCPGDVRQSRRLLGLAARASSLLRQGADAEALHAAALLELVLADEAGNALQRSISYLQNASRMAERSGPVLADLSAALLVRAERTQNARDLFEAVETAELALVQDPRSRTARFNLALALDLLAQDAQARQAWESYLALDSTSGWAVEARGRVRELSRPPPDALPRHGAPARLAAFAEREPQRARIWGMEALLGEWGAAVLRGDTAAAAARLRDAAALAEGLARRGGGDAAVGDMVRAIHAAAGDARATRGLALAHRQYALGMAEYWNGDRSRAEPALAGAARASASPALAQWATVFHAATLVYLHDGGRRDRGERMLRDLLPRVDAARHPALAGRARWNLGTTVVRSNRAPEAARLYAEAAALFARAGERENQGAVEGMRAEALFKSGDAAGAFAWVQRALTTLRPFRSSPWLHNTLYIAAGVAEQQGFMRTALRIQEEDIAVASRAQLDVSAEAYLRRARLRTLAGLDQGAARDRAAIRSLLDRLPLDARRWPEADLRVAEAGAALRAHPARAAAALDSVVAFFGGGASGSRLMQALVQRSDARMALGNVEGAAADLDSVVALLDAQRAGMATQPERAALVDHARQVFDGIVMLHVNAGRAEAALAYLERARTSLAGGVDAAPRTRTVVPPLPAGQVAVAYALVGDTLLTWTLSGAGVHLRRDTVDHAALGRLVERTRSTLEVGAAASASRPLLQALYDRLIRPVQGRLGPEGTPLVLLADGVLADVPFAALLDAPGGRYLVERHPLRVLGSLRDAGRTPPAAAPAGGALLVADPAFDPRAFPGLARLPGAAAEVEALRRQYPGARVLRHDSAGPDQLRRALSRAAVVHYAGHAVFDDAQPDASFLVLAPTRAGGGRLGSAEIAGMDLRGVRLVVLSACQTLRGRQGRSGGFAGLAGAFLSAGAGGVVGTVWQVEDGSTQPLMAEFHRAWRASGDGAGALRQAQLHLLRSADPALRNPAAWAAFRYTGR
jgi:CHAT domain-containing protein